MVEALEGIRAIVQGVVTEMSQRNEPVPAPIADRTYSGEFAVRIPPEVHRRLVIVAAEENISLNRLVSARLAS